MSSMVCSGSGQEPRGGLWDSLLLCMFQEQLVQQDQRERLVRQEPLDRKAIREQQDRRATRVQLVLKAFKATQEQLVLKVQLVL